MRRLPASTRSKSPQTQRSRTKEQRAPLSTSTKKSPPPLAVSKLENQSHLEPRISGGSNDELKRLNNAANSSTAESAAQHDRAIKSATPDNQVSVRKASQESDRKQSLSPLLMDASIPKNLMIGTPSKAAQHTFDQYKYRLEREQADAAQLLKMGNPAAFDSHRFYTEAKTYFEMVQSYRFKTGDTNIDSRRPTSKQLAAFEVELEKNDVLYKRTKYYLNHRHNKPDTMHLNMKASFVDYGANNDLIPKNKRPKPEELYAPQFLSGIMDNHVRGKSTYVIITGRNFMTYAHKTGFHGRPNPSPDYPHGDGELFNTESAAIEEIYRMAGPNPTGESLAEASEKVLGLTAYKSEVSAEDEISYDNLLIAIEIPYGARKNERLGSGRENGATDLWLTGGTTPYGHIEIITDRINMAGLPGTDPAKTAPTVRILGKHGKDVAAYPGNFNAIGYHMDAIVENAKLKKSRKVL
jgi:hypothetical protein